MSAWGNFIESIFGFDLLEAQERRKRRMTIELSLWIVIAGIMYNLVYVYLGYPAAITVSVVSIIATILNILVFYFSKNYKLFKITQLVILVFFGFLDHVILGGFVDGSGVGLCAILAAMGALIFTDVRTARFFFLLFVIGVIGVGIWEFTIIDQPFRMPRKLSLTFFILNFIFIGAIVYFIVESAFTKSNAFQEQLEKEKAKTESLLLNILPSEIAIELKNSGWTKARGYASATVVFSDIVGFSSTARYLTPGKLVEELGLYFGAFDDIMEKYGLEKIKTIGDAYMFVGGIPTESNTHAHDAVRAALEMQKEVERIKSSGQISFPFTLRVGIHSGPIVAGVVGRKKFVYDVWGETVNMAARMEQKGEAGQVNISESTYYLVQREFTCTPRGKISAKNVGDIEMFFVEEKKPVNPLL
ncbi:MAG: adenylate/guanylate cyclase domain-containing protein [Lacibacter sp.]